MRYRITSSFFKLEWLLHESTRRSKQNKPPGGKNFELIQHFWRRDPSKTYLLQQIALSTFIEGKQRKRNGWIREIWGIERLIPPILLIPKNLHSILDLRVIDSVLNLITLIFFSFGFQISGGEKSVWSLTNSCVYAEYFQTVLRVS